MAEFVALVLAGYLSAKFGAGLAAGPPGGLSFSGERPGRRWARAVAGACLLAGAAIGGAPVARSVAALVPHEIAAPFAAPVVTGAAAAAMLLAARPGVPASPGEAVLGAVAGAAVAAGTLQPGGIAWTAAPWLAAPAAAFTAVALLRKVAVGWLEIRLAAGPPRPGTIAAVRLAAAGAACFQAFVAGMNGVSIIAAPAAASLPAGEQASLMASAALGALGLLTAKPHSPAAKEFRSARVSLLDAGLIAVVSGTVLAAAAAAGLPLPWTWVILASDRAVGRAKSARRAPGAARPSRAAWAGLATPLCSFVLAFAACKIASGALPSTAHAAQAALLLLSIASLVLPALSARDQSIPR